jgi:hypothetical protein
MITRSRVNCVPEVYIIKALPLCSFIEKDKHGRHAEHTEVTYWCLQWGGSRSLGRIIKHRFETVIGHWALYETTRWWYWQVSHLVILFTARNKSDSGIHLAFYCCLPTIWCSQSIASWCLLWPVTWSLFAVLRMRAKSELAWLLLIKIECCENSAKCFTFFSPANLTHTHTHT